MMDEYYDITATYPHLNSTLCTHRSTTPNKKNTQVSERDQSFGNQTEKVMHSIAAKAKTLPPCVAGDGDLPLLAGLELTKEQRQLAERIQAADVADFALRRRMLLRRCDVTVQSFMRRKQGDTGPADLPAALKV